jgi:uncharacterized membrane protein
MSETLVSYLKERPDVFYADCRKESEISQKCGRLTDTSFTLGMSVFAGILSVLSGTRESHYELDVAVCVVTLLSADWRINFMEQSCT